jgi:hypothetical protein
LELALHLMSTPAGVLDPLQLPQDPAGMLWQDAICASHHWHSYGVEWRSMKVWLSNPEEDENYALWLCLPKGFKQQGSCQNDGDLNSCATHTAQLH